MNLRWLLTSALLFKKLSACLVRKRLPVRDHYCNLIQSMCVCPVQVCSSKPLIPWNDSPFEWKSNCSAVFLTHTLKPLWQCSLHNSDSLLEMPVISEPLTNSDLKSVSQELWRIEHTHTHMASENTVSLEKECKYYFHDSFQSCNKTPRSVAAKAKIQTWTSGFDVKQLYRFRFDPVWQSHFTNSLQFYLKGWCNK